MTKREELLHLAAKKMDKQLDEDPELLVRVLARAVNGLVEQLAKPTGKTEGELGGEAILAAVAEMLDTGAIAKSMPSDFSKDQATIALDLIVHAMALAVCTRVKAMV